MTSARDEYRRLDGELRAEARNPLYLFYGEEPYYLKMAMDLAVKLLLTDGLKEFNLDKLDGETSTPSDWVAKASNMPMLGSRRLVLVSAADKWLKSTGGKAAKAELEALDAFAASERRSGALVLVTGQVDKRLRVFKRLQEKKLAFHFPPLRSVREAERFVEDRLHQLGIESERGVASYLAEVLGTEIGTILTEVRRLQLFLGDDRKRLSLDDVEGLVARTRTHTLFEFTEALSEKDGPGALAVLDRLLEGGVKSDRKTDAAGVPLVLLSLLARSLRQMSITRSLGNADPGELARRLGVPRGIAGKIRGQSRRFKDADLQAALDGVFEADRRLKSTAIPARFLLEDLVFRLCS